MQNGQVYMACPFFAFESGKKLTVFAGASYNLHLLRTVVQLL